MPKVARSLINDELFATDVAPAFRVEQRVVTPQQAIHWLETALQNRLLAPARVSEYAQDMRHHQWLLSGQPLLFDQEQRLMDGRHRLNACIEAQTPFETFIIYGLPHSVMPVIDTGKARTGSDVLSIVRGVSNAKQIASALRWVWLIGTGKVTSYGHRATMPRMLLLDYLDAHPDLSHSLPAARKTYRILIPGLSVALHYLYAKKDPELADRFFHDLAHGEELHHHDLMYVLRERLMKDWGAKTKMTPVYKAALTIKVWNAWRHGKFVGHMLRWRDDTGEPFPTIT